MRCPICNDFARALEDRASEYRQACSNTVYCHISSRFVAYSEIEMSRAKSELEIHQSVCAVCHRWEKHEPQTAVRSPAIFSAR
jgi:hypothetical protein